MAQSSSSGGGSLIGGIIGAVAGFFMSGGNIGGAFKGFMWGSAIGGMLVPPSGPDIVEPSIADASIMTSSNIVDIPTFSGTMGLYGNIILAKDDKLQEVVTTTTKKKKLLGFTVAKQKTTTKTYYLNCVVAFALMDEEDDCLLIKFWMGDKLMLNRTSDDVGTIVESGNFEDYITFYPGTDDQPIDPFVLEEYTKRFGPNSAPAWPALAYVVIRDLDMSPWQDSVDRAQIKAELTSGSTTPSDLEFLSQTPATLHPQYESNYNANFLDSDGLHVWKWGEVIAEESDEADTSWANYSPYDFMKLHYVAVPGGGGYLKEKFEIIPQAYLHDPATANATEQKRLRHTSKGKADVNAAVFVTAFAKTSAGGGGGGGSYPHPSLLVPGQWKYQSIQPIVSNSYPHDTFYSAYTQAFSAPEYLVHFPGPPGRDRFDPDMQRPITNGLGQMVGIYWAFYPPGHVFDYPHFYVSWTDGASDANPPAIPYPLSADMFSDSPWVVTFSVTLVMPGFVKEFIISSSGLYDGPVSSYVVHDGRFYWGATINGAAVVYELNINGWIVSTNVIPWTTNPVSLVRIGVVDDRLVIIAREGEENPILRIFDGMDLGDVSTYTDYDSAEIDTAFGFTGIDFINNTSMDFDKFIYFRDPNIYTKDSFDADEQLLGDPDGDLIPGEEAPEFFNFWLQGNLLAVSTKGGSMPEVGAQFFTIGLLGEPGTVQLADIIRKYCRKAGLADADLNTSLIVQEVRGHRVAKRGAARNIIEQLRALWPFDMIPSGYQLKCVPRGQEPVITVSYLDLGPDAQWTQDREMSTQLAWKMTLRYLDRDLEYEADEQPSKRPIASDHEQVIEVPVVLTANEGARAIDVLHSMFLIERISYTGFVLPPTMRELEPADVILVEFPDVTYEVRITNLKTLSNGALQGDGKPNGIAFLTSTAVGESKPPPPQTIPVAGGATTILMDIPIIALEEPPGFWAVMASAFENWTGGMLWKKKGNLWEQAQAFGGNCTFGVCSTKLNVHGCHLVDRGSTLTVALHVGTITTVTKAEFFDEELLVAYGDHGRWEIMSCRNVTPVSGNVYTVNTFLRGLRGTEWATGLHQNTDYFVSLIDVDNEFIELLEAEIGTTLIFRGASNGQDISTQFDSALNYQAENLKPTSPARVKSRLDGNDIIFMVTRRDRLYFSWSNDLEVPMSEENKSFIIDIYDGAPLVSTKVRTIEFTTEDGEEDEVTYTEAQQIADFGSVIDEANISARQVSAIVGPGRPWTGTVITNPDTSIYALYWGLEIGQAVTSTDVGVAELRFYDKNGTQIPTTGGTAYASSFFSGTYVPANAFDGNTANSWNSASSSFPARIYYGFAAPVAVFSYEIIAIGTADAPEDFKPIYSNTNVYGDFQFGTQRTGQTGWTVGVPGARSFDVF